ncbi:MAG: ATP-binding cassette domain-containing protein [Frankia sp.]
MDSGALTVRTASGETVLTHDRSYVIGRGREADIVVEGTRISRRHVLLEPARAGWTARDTSANGLWRDGRRISDVTVADTQVHLRLGAADGPEVVLTLVAPAAPAPREPGLHDSDGDDVSDMHTSLPNQSGPVRFPPPPRPLNARATPSTSPPPSSGPAGRPGRSSPAPAFGPVPTSGAPTNEQTLEHDLTSSGSRRRTHQLRPGRLTMGRSKDNDLAINDLLASRHHAELRVGRDVVEIVDLASANGTFVNGQRVTRSPIAQRDVIAVGHHLFQLEGTELVSYVDSGDVTFEVQALSVWAGKKQLMHDMTFRLPGRSLLGVVGPSGAGKSTLLNALTGFRPADAGTVRYAGRDLYAEYDELRRRIGYVPQADPLHGQLTVREALEYGAELRFPPDTTADERRARVAEVIGQLGLSAHASTQVNRLSGGQRKRTSVALELLTRPTLMFLDEPTSGLDPANDQSVMEALRSLAKGAEPREPAATGPSASEVAGGGAGSGGGSTSANDEGRTVIVVTHSVLFLDLCDYLLVMAPGGHVAYFGPSDGALSFFGKKDFKEFATVFRDLEETPGEVCAARFRASEHYVPSAVVAPSARATPSELPSLRQQPVHAQLSTLVRRYLRVVIADTSYLRLVIAFPFLLGIIPRVIPAPHGLDALARGPNPDATKVLVVLVLCACFMGMANSVREIVKERPIYRRERTIGLSRTAYLGSKVVVLTGLTTLQCVVFALIGLVGRLPPGSSALGSPLLECLVAVVVAAFASMMIGLLVSALVDSADKTMPVLVLVTMGQLVLSGGLVSAAGQPILEQVSWVAPARWGFAALASSDNLNEVAKLGVPTFGSAQRDPLWDHTAAVWWGDIAVGLVIAVIALGLTAVALRRLEPNVSRARAGAGAGAPPVPLGGTRG